MAKMPAIVGLDADCQVFLVLAHYWILHEFYEPWYFYRQQSLLNRPPKITADHHFTENQSLVLIDLIPAKLQAPMVTKIKPMVKELLICIW